MEENDVSFVGGPSPALRGEGGWLPFVPFPGAPQLEGQIVLVDSFSGVQAGAVPVGVMAYELVQEARQECLVKSSYGWELKSFGVPVVLRKASLVCVVPKTSALAIAGEQLNKLEEAVRLLNQQHNEAAERFNAKSNQAERAIDRVIELEKALNVEAEERRQAVGERAIAEARVAKLKKAMGDRAYNEVLGITTASPQHPEPAGARRVELD